MPFSSGGVTRSSRYVYPLERGVTFLPLTDPRVTPISKSQQSGLGKLLNATYIRGVPIFGKPCPAPPVIFSQKTEQLHGSVLHQFIDAFVPDFGEMHVLLEEKVLKLNCRT